MKSVSGVMGVRVKPPRVYELLAICATPKAKDIGLVAFMPV